MRDNLRRYRAILDTLQQLSPTPVIKQQARHLRTLTALISGIVGSRQTPYRAKSLSAALDSYAARR